MAAPFDQFAERIVRNHEYEQLVIALKEAGGSLSTLVSMIAKHTEDDPDMPMGLGQPAFPRAHIPSMEI